MESRTGSMLLTLAVAVILAGIYSTSATPIQAVEKRIFCNMIGCASKRSHESSNSIDAFDADDSVVPLKKDMSAENLLSRGEISPSSIRQRIQQAWLSNSPEETRHLPSARGLHERPSFDDTDLKFWREMQAKMWPRYDQRIRRDAKQMLKKLRAPKQTQEV